MYGKGTLHKIFPREANVESELSLQTKREFLQQMIPQYRKATRRSESSNQARIPSAHDTTVSQGIVCQEEK